MVWRTVVVSSPARLSCENRQLVVKTEELRSSVPCEDLAVLVIDHSQVSLTAPLLQTLSDENVALVVCDRTHTPSGLYLSLNQHSRMLEVVERQMQASAPFKKRCWQKIVIAKIENQLRALEALNRQNVEILASLARKVGSGDPENIEAQAARRYWPLLFSDDFRRGANTAVNAALNYGYAIVRSAVARALVSRGFLTCLGVHHKSKLNSFNLADDFVEPFRPMVDLAVARLFIGREPEFGRDERHSLVNVVNEQVRIGGEQMIVLRAAEIVASSLVTALSEKAPDALFLPEVVHE